MRYYYVIRGGYIVDHVLWDGICPFAYPFQHDLIMESEGFGGIGWSYLDGELHPPPDEETFTEE